MSSAASFGGTRRASTKRLRCPASAPSVSRTATVKPSTQRTATHAAWLTKELAAAVQHPVKLPKRLAVTDEEEQEICELYAKQMSIALVASSMHRSPQTVRAVLAKNDVEIRKGGPRITTKMIKQYTE